MSNPESIGDSTLPGTALSGRTALVLGGAGPVGSTIARALAAAGARVCAADPNLDTARSLATDISGMALPFEPLDSASHARLAYAFGDAWGDPDILVNAVAPPQVARPMEELTEPDFDRTTALCSRPLFLAVRHFLPAMKLRGHGVVLTHIPVPARLPRNRPGWHGPARAWAMAATESLAAEYAPHGIRVNAIMPTTDDSTPVPSFMGGTSSTARQQALATIPLGRFAAPADIGAAAAFLCSDAAAFLTGVILPVDGGRRL
jgi:3-oxoacyl-[acyl-carrier protein] reductase